MPDEGLTIEPSVEFVETNYFRDLTARALTYLNAGIPLHLEGPSGTGKTTLAFHLATCLERPVVLISGNDQFTPSDLVGRHFGLRRKLLIDNYIHSVERREEYMSSDWVDGRLLAACRNGWTLVYDEFSRSRPEANNALLSVLEEGIIELPSTYPGEKHVRVHPDFRVIFTSNPDEYAGVHRRPDALLERMITINLGDVDDESVLSICVAKTGIALEEAKKVVDTVRYCRSLDPDRPGYSIRSALMIASVLRSSGHSAESGDPFFERLCRDVLGLSATRSGQPRPASASARFRRNKEPKLAEQEE